MNVSPVPSERTKAFWSYSLLAPSESEASAANKYIGNEQGGVRRLPACVLGLNSAMSPPLKECWD